MFRVLIANRDDYDTNGMQWLLKTSLSNLEIKIAKTIQELMDELDHFAPDLLILELDMIQDDLLPVFKKSLNICNPIIISMTIEATFNQAKLAIDIGVKELLLKPITPEVLLKSVRNLLRENPSSKMKNQLVESAADSTLIQYNELFIENGRSSESYIFIGMRSEKDEALPLLYRFVKDFPFSGQLDCFALNDMVLCIGKRDNQVDWNRECKYLMMKWTETNSEPVVISMNKGLNGTVSIRERFMETRKMMEEVFYIGFKQVISHEHPPVWKFIDPFLTPAEQRIWIDLLNQFNSEGIKEWLYLEFLHLKKPYPDPGLVRIRLTSLLAQIRRHMKSYQLTDSLIETKYLDIFQRILYSPVIYKIVQDMILFISEIFILIKNGKDIKQDLIEKTIRFIESNYWNDQLSLQQVADYVDRNSSYLSVKITESTGKSFRELLNQIRLREAKKLLIESDMPIKEIAHICGFKYQPYFQKVFKKYENISPNDYRKQSSLKL